MGSNSDLLKKLAGLFAWSKSHLDLNILKLFVHGDILKTLGITRGLTNVHNKASSDYYYYQLVDIFL